MSNVRGLQNLPPELARQAEKMAAYGSCISLISFSGVTATGVPSPESPLADERPIYVRNSSAGSINVAIACCQLEGSVFPVINCNIQEAVAIAPGMRTRLARRVDEGGEGSTAVVGYLNVRIGGREVKLSDESFTIGFDDCFMVLRQRFGSVSFLCGLPPGLSISEHNRFDNLDDTDFIFDLNGERVPNLPDHYLFFNGNGLNDNNILRSIRSGQVHTFYRIDLGADGGTFDVKG